VVFEITAGDQDPRSLSQAVLQIIALLDLFHAELARVLHLRCGDIGELASARHCLEPDTEAWEQALLFVRFYRALYTSMDGDGVAMRHWLRVEHTALGGVPHLLIVDEDRLQEVVMYLEQGTRGADTRM
jgi:hypothetical protein